MRELKFRIWCKGTSTNANFNKPRWILPTDFILLKYYRCFQDVIESDDFVVQQYTGLKDKNGKEIHEGDIVDAIHFVFDFKYKDNERPENYSGTIRWNHSYWAIGDYKLFVMEDDSLNVIGNIFENPELLK